MTFDNDTEALEFLASKGLKPDMYFYFQLPANRILTEEESDAIHYLMWEWDYGVE